MNTSDMGRAGVAIEAEMHKDTLGKLSRVKAENGVLRDSLDAMTERYCTLRALLTECLDQVDGELAERIKEVI